MSFDVDENKKRFKRGQDIWDYSGSMESYIAEARVTEEEEQEARSEFRLDQTDSNRALRMSRRKRTSEVNQQQLARMREKLRQAQQRQGGTASVRQPARNPRNFQNTGSLTSFSGRQNAASGKRLVKPLAVAVIVSALLIIGAVFSLIAGVREEEKPAEEFFQAYGIDGEEDTEWSYDGPALDDCFTIVPPEGYVDLGDRTQDAEGQSRIWYDLGGDEDADTQGVNRLYAEILYGYSAEDVQNATDTGAWDDTFETDEAVFGILRYYENDSDMPSDIAAFFTHNDTVYDISLGHWDGEDLTAEEVDQFYEVLDTLTFTEG